MLDYKSILSLSLLFSATVASIPPARAGDDCESATIGPWYVVNDAACDMEISRSLTGDSQRITLSFRLTGSPAAAQSLRISFPAKAGVTNVKASIGRKDLGTVTATDSFRFSTSAAGDIFTALRKGRSAVLTVSYNTGIPISYTLDSVQFEAAYKRLAR